MLEATYLQSKTQSENASTRITMIDYPPVGPNESARKQRMARSQLMKTQLGPTGAKHTRKQKHQSAGL